MAADMALLTTDEGGFDFEYGQPAVARKPSGMPQEEEIRAGAAIQPLHTARGPARSRSAASSHTRASSNKTARSPSVKSQAHISPPLTPRGSREIMPRRPDSPTFHNYLRAFHAFHPASTVSSSTDESSVTVPINQGDVILVHSIHPNGWADGTLLASGARGWLPTNYCEAYDHVAVRNLLNAMTHLWDLVRTVARENLNIFARQDHVRGMIAGVRLFLVSSPGVLPVAMA